MPNMPPTLKQHDIEPIDLVVCNLYPFEATVAGPAATHEEIVENIDIGGPIAGAVGGQELSRCRRRHQSRRNTPPSSEEMQANQRRLYRWRRENDWRPLRSPASRLTIAAHQRLLR